MKNKHELKTSPKVSPRMQGRPSIKSDKASATADVREHLLTNATQLFASQGIAATSMAQIAKLVGVTPAMVHYYFTNREQLLDAVIEERVMLFIGSVLDTLQEAPHNPASISLDDQVRQLVTRIIDGAQRMPWMPPLWIREILSEGGQLRERLLQRIPVTILLSFAQRIRKAQQQGLVNAGIEPRIFFLSILGVVMLPLATEKFWAELPLMQGVNHESLHNHAVTLLLDGLLHNAPSMPTISTSPTVAADPTTTAQTHAPQGEAP